MLWIAVHRASLAAAVGTRSCSHAVLVQYPCMKYSPEASHHKSHSFIQAMGMTEGQGAFAAGAHLWLEGQCCMYEVEGRILEQALLLWSWQCFCTAQLSSCRAKSRCQVGGALLHSTAAVS